MTPHLRSVWEVKHNLGKKDIETATHYIDNVEVLDFSPFHYRSCTVSKVTYLWLIQRGLEALDSVILRLPLLKWQAWMVVFVLSQPIKK